MTEGLPVCVYDADQAAEILRCTASWLKDQARLRKIPFTMIGGSYRWTAEHLLEIVKLGEQAPAIRPPRQVSRQLAGVAVGLDAPALKARPPRRARGPDTAAGPVQPGPAQAVAAEPSTRDLRP